LRLGVSDTALAIALALASTLGYGASFVLTQFGLQRIPPWLGAAFSVPTATLLFWCMAPFAIDTTTMDFDAIALFAGIGLFFPASVTLLNFESNRLMGANIAGTLAGLTPVFAVGLALYLLGERPRLSQWLALAAIAGGVMLMGRRRQQNFPASSLWVLLLPLAASAIRGGVQPVIKLGLRHWPSPIAAVVIGYSISSVMLIVAAVIRNSGWPRHVDRRGALWFAAVGICNGMAVLLTYAALGYGTVALVAPLIAGYPLIIMLLSHILLKDEPLNAQILTAVAAIVGGVIILMVG
jgi:drug/metabolite transporter (DMT)-like permease